MHQQRFKYHHSQLLPQIQLAFSPFPLLGLLLLLRLLLPFLPHLVPFDPLLLLLCLLLFILLDYAILASALPAPFASGTETHAFTLCLLAFARVLFRTVGDSGGGGEKSPPSVRRAVDYAH